jgi:hypothetical protein
MFAPKQTTLGNGGVRRETAAERTKNFFPSGLPDPLHFGNFLNFPLFSYIFLRTLL